MDAKALYDMLCSEQQNQDDARAALEVSVIKEDMQTLRAVARWVPHDKNPTDALTKVEGAHATPLLQMLQKCMYQIRAEQEELQHRAEVREELGYNPRPRHTGLVKEAEVR